MEEISLWASQNTATGTGQGPWASPDESRFLSGPAHTVQLLTPVSAAVKYSSGPSYMSSALQSLWIFFNKCKVKTGQIVKP